MCVPPRLLLGQLPQNVLENAAVAEVIGLTGRIDPDSGLELHRTLVLAFGGDVHTLRSLPEVQRRDPANREGLFSAQSQRIGCFTIGELQR